MPRASHIVRIVGAAVLALITLEVSARVDDYVTHGAPLAGYFDIQTIYEYDELGRRGKPNAEYLKWKLNSLGFRGPELEPEKLTVAVLGASETFGMYESDDLEFPRQLETILRERFGDAVQVANIAYAGMSVGQALLRLDETLESVQPDLLVVYPSVAAYADAPKGEWRLGKQPQRPRLAVFRIYERMRDLLKNTIPEWLQTEIREMQAEQSKQAAKGWQALPEANVRRFEAELNDLVERTEAFGAEVALVTHATRFGDRVLPEERPFLIAWRKFYPQLAEDGFLDMERRLNAVVRDAAEERGLPLIDAAKKMEPGAENFVEFVHFTDQGARRLAELIAEGIAPSVDRLLHPTPKHAAKQVP